MVVALLGMQVVLGFAAVTLATGDASFAVVPGYHEQALHWDENRALLRNSAALGWIDRISADATADVLGRRTLSIALQDESGRPLTHASVAATVFHHARANEVQNVSFVESAVPGRYSVELPMRQNGLWEVRLNATRGAKRFAMTRRIEVAADREPR
jgi:nitrogen fixation protein FixH